MANIVIWYSYRRYCNFKAVNKGLARMYPAPLDFVKTFVSKPTKQEAEIDNNSLIKAYLSTLILTITNPLTVLSFVAFFGGLGLANTNTDYKSAAVLVLGVFLGSACWWLILSIGVDLIRNRLNSDIFQLVNKASGIIILAFGLTSLCSLRQF